MGKGRLRRSHIGGLAGVLIALAAACPAAAQTKTLDGVQIAGEPVVGSTLTAVISGSADPAEVAFKWCRQGERPDKCARGAPVGAGPVYVPVPADVGSRLIVTATATIDSFEIRARSAPTAVVLAEAPAPEPTPDPTPDPEPDPTPDPQGEPTTAPAAAAPPPGFGSAGVDPVSAGPGAPLPVLDRPARPRYLTPFPVVRIRGYVAARGARVTLLKVTAPRGVTVAVRCAGSGCPAIRRRSRSPGRIRALERFLPAGTRITIRVRRPGFIGKYARIRIRAGGPPSRRDACLAPGSGRPVSCPAG